MKAWGNLDLENQREIDRFKADRAAEKHAKTSEEIAELTKDIKVKYYDAAGNLIKGEKS